MTSSSSVIDPARNKRRIGRIWERLKAFYGKRWEAEYGPASAGNELLPIANIWAETLERVADENISAGIKACLERESPHPPTLPEFYRMCATHRPIVEKHEPSPLRFCDIYTDQPSMKCERIAAQLAEQADDDLVGVRALPGDERKNATRAYWISKIGSGIFADAMVRQLEKPA